MLKVDAKVMPAEFQAVVMAAGKGSRMSDVTSGCPKPLLPVGNYPLVWYPVNMLERAGFEEAFVVVLDTFEEDVKTALRDVYKVKINLEFVALDDQSFWGTAETLRHLNENYDIKSDLLVVSCDLISNVKLQQVANVHRTHDSSVTMMLTPLMHPFLTASPPGLKGGKKKERDVMALDKTMKRVLYSKPHADLMDKGFFEWQAPMRNIYPNMYIGSKLTDCHLYIMKKWVLDYLCDKNNPEVKKITSIKSDLIPHIIKCQFLTPSTPEDDDMDMRESSSKVKTVLDYAEGDPNVKLVKNQTFFPMDHDNGVRVYAFRQTEGFVVRVNTLGTYCEANRQIHSFLTSKEVDLEVVPVSASATLKEKAQVGQDCLVGDGTTVGSRTQIKKSNVGSHCVIGDNVKISHSIIMDHVHIADGCNIQGSLICSHASLEEKGEIKESVVGQRQKLQAKCKLTHELVCTAEGMMQL